MELKFIGHRNILITHFMKTQKDPVFSDSEIIMIRKIYTLHFPEIQKDPVFKDAILK
jgi:hypothetical protein